MSEPIDYNAFALKIIKWYGENQRDLPWRKTTDPYHIWLSEVILQQTRVAQGLDYYNRFIEAFPSVDLLAQADESTVLRLWQGLGYYSRARNLHAAAKYIHVELNDTFPACYKDILKLKGVGEYTAAAIASFAFKEAQAVVDGNVYRVLSRVFGITDDISAAPTKKVFRSLAQKIIPNDKPDLFNQGIMEFGALHCLPRNPKCDECPLSFQCVAYKSNLQDQLPVKTKKVKTRNRFFNYLVIEFEDRYILKKRGSQDIWAGLYDFPLIETSNEIKNINQLIEEWDLKAYLKPQEFVSCESMPTHILSHQKIISRFWKFRVSKSSDFESIGNFYPSDEIQELPKPVLVNNYLKQSIF